MANRSERHLGIIRHVAHILKSESAGAQVKRVLRRYLNRLEQEAPRRGRGAQTGHFVDHVVKVANSYWPGLFHAYDHPQIPRTSNTLEGFLGSIKHEIRTTTGRASTVGSTMDSYGELAVQVKALVHVLPKEELKQRIADVTDDALKVAKKKLAEIHEPARERRSIVRRPEAFLERVVSKWFGPRGG